MAISGLDLYILISPKIGDTEAKAVTEYFDIQVESKFVDAKATLSTKEDIAIVRKEIAESKTDRFKWVFAFFAALSLMIMGLYLKK